MKIILSLNKKERLYDYVSMGIDIFVLGGKHSFYCPFSFEIEEMKDMIDMYPQCHFYVAMNALYDQYIMDDIEKYIDSLNEIGVYGIVFQDFGILQIVKEKNYSFDMMYSPDTLNTNAYTLNTLENHGITSAFISKVIPLEEQLIIQNEVSMPLMIHGHGVEYIATSKRKLLSNYKEASSLSFDLKGQNNLTLKARNSDYEFQVYEDEKGVHIFSKTRLYTLDLLNQIHHFDYWYIETLMMNEEEAIEVASLYSDALMSLKKETYDRDVKEYMNLLYRLKTPLDRGFLFDQTVYKLEDMRKMDNERNQSNH
ncbi:MAG: U32 family peptidase [Erysipelotrichales bacterium]|nr:U32 family peptidase [Erysipelotrichales bacterium]